MAANWSSVLARDDPEVRMPPPDGDVAHLTAAELQDTAKLDRAGGGVAGRRGRQPHTFRRWALQPLQRPEVPSGAAHPIDAFVRQRLAAQR